MHTLKGWLVVVVVLSACEDDNPVNKLPDAPVVPDAMPDAPRTCITPTGAGTVHTTNLAAPETWTEAASPHIIMNDTTVAAAITIEPCAVVRIDGARTVTVRDGGTITANGQPGLPVTFERLMAATAYGPVRAIGGSLSLTHTTIKGGGNPLGNPASGSAIVMQRSVSATGGSLHMDTVEIVDSASHGVSLSGVAGFDTTSQALTIRGSAGHAIISVPNLLGSIPTGTYTGNAIDEVMIDDSGGAITTTQTLHDRGIPYRVGDEANSFLDVAAVTGVATLTIEPGVTLKFHPGGRLRIDTTTGGATPAKGALIAVGTAARPIVFTSVAAAPVAGAWQGIWFSGELDVATRMQHTRVEYAGGPSATGSGSCPYPGRVGQNDAAIRIFGAPAPLTQFITETVILASARDGIDRGWSNDGLTDFQATNTFTGVAECNQSFPRQTSTACPTTPPCP